MKRLGFSCIFFVMIALAACASQTETSDSETPSETVPIPDLIRQADDLYRQREDLSKIRQGVALLRRARNADAQNYEANWKLAKFDYYLGDSTNDEKESDKAFKEGIDAGKIAERLAPDKPDGYFWTGANLGGRAEKNPLTKGITSIDDIREAMNKTIEIQPDYQGASAYDVLAQVELSTHLTGGKAEKAVEYLEKALELEKENSYIRLHLAEAYLAVDRKADAKKQLDYILNMKPDPDYLPEYKDSVEEAKQMLKTRF
ncbi:MAG: tetratricopeptide repeat protein [Pyrinomonadaceae bacterium]